MDVAAGTESDPQPREISSGRPWPARCTTQGMRRIAPIALLALMGCSSVCLRRACGPAETLTGAAAIAVSIAVDASPNSSEAWCVQEDADPPHTCPARVGESPR